MALAVVCWIIGGVWYFIAFSSTPDSAVQETVRYLVFLNGSVFIVGGFILARMNKNKNNEKQAGNIEGVKIQKGLWEK